MIKVITYGTFDLLHRGHLNILKRAKGLGDYLIVGVTSNNYDIGRGKMNVQQSLVERISNVLKTGLADEVIVEEYEGQKIDDINKLSVDIFVLGSDWIGKFDYLNEYCKVVYLDRTKDVSSSMLREANNPILKLGMIGTGRIAARFMVESKYVSNIEVKGVFNPRGSSASRFADVYKIDGYSNNFDSFLSAHDAVYIASPHLTHYDYIKKSLLAGKHVLCEKPMVLKETQAVELYMMADKRELVLMEAIKCAYSPGFMNLIAIAKSGIIGDIRHVDATFTKLIPSTSREFDVNACGGSMTELGSYVLFAIIKTLGLGIQDVKFDSFMTANVDYFTHGMMKYKNAVATFKVGIGVKSEGDLVISGTKGYLYVPAPWWKTEYFECRFEDLNATRKYFYNFYGDGLRYELSDFAKLINKKIDYNYKLTHSESIAISRIIETFLLKGR